MIEYIKGEITELTPTQMIMECAGIGYLLNISLNTYSTFNGKSTEKSTYMKLSVKTLIYYMVSPRKQNVNYFCCLLPSRESDRIPPV